MKTYKTVTVEQRKIDSVTCDWCGGPAPESPSKRLPFSFPEVTVKCVAGAFYPGCDSREVESTDLCLDCWDKLVALLKERGCKFRTWPSEDGEDSEPSD